MAALGLFALGMRRLVVADFAYATATADLTETLKTGPRADLYIAHYIAALPAAARAAREHKALFAFDAEDFHLGDLPDNSANSQVRSLVKYIESKYLPLAAYVTAASPLIGENYAEIYDIKHPTTILNVFPRPTEPHTCVVPEGNPSIYWFSQTIGPDRGLEVAMHAIAISRSRPHFYIRGNPALGYIERLRAIAAQLGVAEQVHFLAPCEPTELERLGAAFDIGYVGEQSHTQNRQIALTNKLFSYISSGIPIVASNIPAHQAISENFGQAMILFNSDSPKSLADCFDHYLLNPRNLLNAKAEAWRLAQTVFNWEIEEEKLINVVKATLSKSDN